MKITSFVFLMKQSLGNFSLFMLSTWGAEHKKMNIEWNPTFKLIDCIKFHQTFLMWISSTTRKFSRKFQYLFETSSYRKRASRSNFFRFCSSLQTFAKSKSFSQKSKVNFQLFLLFKWFFAARFLSRKNSNFFTSIMQSTDEARDECENNFDPHRVILYYYFQ
jgi:hypothetical protein